MEILIRPLAMLIFAAMLVGWFARPASDPAEVGSFALGHGLDLTRRNLPMVTYYVRLAVTLRAIGGVSGLVLGGLFDDSTGLNTSAGVGFWIWILMGWLLGASWAEFRLTRPRSPDLAASLTPRRASDYASVPLLVAPAVAAATTALITLGRFLSPEPARPSAVRSPSEAYVAGTVGSVVIAGCILLAIRTVVARRQPTGPPDIVAADDAIRASAVHHLAGGGTAAILLIAAQLAFAALGRSEDHTTLALLAEWVLGFAAFVSWRWYAYRHWRVRRQAAVGSMVT